VGVDKKVKIRPKDPMRDIPSLSQQIEYLRRLKTSSILLIRKAARGISHQKGRLGIFSASFNPPTKAHLALIRKAGRLESLDETLVLLDAQAMDKKLIGAGLEDRVIMLKKLFQRDPRISIGISNRGLFAEKLLPLKRLYPSPTSFIFIVGFDTILRVMDRKYYKNPEESLDKLFRESCFLVANRGQRDQKTCKFLLEPKGNKKYEDKISFLALPKEFSSISSVSFETDLGKANLLRIGSPPLSFALLKRQSFTPSHTDHPLPSMDREDQSIVRLRDRERGLAFQGRN